MLKRCFWNLLKTKKKGCLKQGKPLRNVRLGSLQATRPNSRKRCLGRACEKAEPQQVLCPSHCETAAGKNAETSLLEPIKKKEIGPKPCETAARKLPKRCFWNLRKNKEKTCKLPGQTQEKGVWDAHAKSRTPVGFVPKPLRNRSQ